MNHAADFQAFLITEAGSHNSAQAAATYTGAMHHHYDVAVPRMRAFLKEWKSTHKTLSYQEFIDTVDALYLSNSVEEKQFAGMLLAQYPKSRAQVDLSQLDSWLDELVGWMEVDSTCQSVFTAKDLLADWDNWQPFLAALTASSNINKRRAALVFLIRPIRENSDKRFLAQAFTTIDALKDEKEILITKAISWLLRTAIKHHRDDIAVYLEQEKENLPAIAIRETSRKLATGRK